MSLDQFNLERLGQTKNMHHTTKKLFDAGHNEQQEETASEHIWVTATGLGCWEQHHQ